MQTQPTSPQQITSEVRQRLGDLATKIKTHRAALVECDAQLPQMAERIERHGREFQTALECSDPDNAAALKTITEGTGRKIVLQNSARSIPGRRQQIMAELVQDMRELDKILLPISPANEQRHFYDLKNSEFVRIDEALAVIAAKLK